MSFLIVHLHIFKNAGTSIDHFLRSNFGGNFLDLDQEENLKKIHFETGDTKNLLDCIHKAHPNLKAVSSHNFRYPLNDTQKIKYIDLVFMRHPLSRLFSMYKFYLKDKSNNQKYFCKGESFASFLEYMFENEPFNTFNSQTCFFANSGDYYYPPNEREFLRALEKIKKVRFLGCVDLFNESMRVGAYYMKPIFGPLKIFDGKINGCDHEYDNYSMEKTIDIFKNKYGSIIDHVLETNSYDICLHDAAKKEVKRRSKIICQF